MTTKLEQAARQAVDAMIAGNDEWPRLDVAEAITALREALAEREANQVGQEPVAWIEIERGIPMFVKFADKYKPNCDGFIPLYAAPSRTKDLTDDEIAKIKGFYAQASFETIVRAAIAADREKNK